jgi:glycerophosphoryl diester phosphodiesterase
MERRWPRVVTVGVVLLVGCGGGAQADAACPPSPFRSTPPQVIAHGGGEGLGPSNTILAMQRSMAAGADVLDADLWMTADGIIVARHDRDLATTTDGVGNIDEVTWDALQRLDTRAKWTGEPISEPVRIPSLEQILTEFRDTRISLEIKQTSPSMAVPLCRVLEETASFDRVYLSANDDAAVYAAQAECPASTVITTTYTDVAAMRSAKETGAAWCAPAPIGQPPYREGRFTAADVQWSHDHGMAIYTWTVDDPETLLQLAQAGVDGVYTRRPDVARRVFDEFAAATS